MDAIAPYWKGVFKYDEIYKTIAEANRNGVFYICDFFILLIIFGKYTLNQKLGLVFELLSGFDDRFQDDKEGKQQKAIEYGRIGLMMIIIYNKIFIINFVNNFFLTSPHTQSLLL